MKITEFAAHTKRLSRSITAAGLLACVLTVGTLTALKNHSALISPTPDPETGAIPSLKERITQAYDKSIAGFGQFLSVFGITQRVLGTSVYEDAGYGYLIRDTKNFLHYNTFPIDVTPYADAVSALREDLAAADIPFLYLQAPVKEIDGFTKYPPGITYASADNARAMGEALRARGVDVLSLADALADAGMKPAELFYRTDHHWTTEAAFAAFSLTLPYLNEHYGLSLDTTLSAPEKWNTLSQPSSFLGSIGRRIGEELAGLDDYTYIEPAFETSYRVYYPPISTQTPYWSGSFREALVRESLLFSEDHAANRYASYFQYDYGQLIIENTANANGLRIAVIKDSFALPYTAFFSTAVTTVDMIDLREYEGSVTEHLLETKPDLVLMLYNNEVFSAPMYQFND